MDPDNLVIRRARPDEAELLSDILFRAWTYCDYPRELIDYWVDRGVFCVSSEEIEQNPVYVAEDDESEEVVGFYAIEPTGAQTCGVRHICVLPEYVGTDVMCQLFLHACEEAETAGAAFLTAAANQHQEAFYEEMGAERIGERIDRTPLGTRALPVLRWSL